MPLSVSPRGPSSANIRIHPLDINCPTLSSTTYSTQPHFESLQPHSPPNHTSKFLCVPIINVMLSSVSALSKRVIKQYHNWQHCCSTCDIQLYVEPQLQEMNYMRAETFLDVSAKSYCRHFHSLCLAVFLLLIQASRGEEAPNA